MHCTILYYTILYCTVLYCTILYYTILYYTMLYYAMLYYTIPYYTILYYAIPYWWRPRRSGTRTSCAPWRGTRGFRRYGVRLFTNRLEILREISGLRRLVFLSRIGAPSNSIFEPGSFESPRYLALALLVHVWLGLRRALRLPRGLPDHRCALNICIYIYIYIHTYIHTYIIHMYTYIDTHTYTHIRIIYIYIYIDIKLI